MFITVNTTKGFGELITNQLSILKDEELRLSIKIIIPEHIVKIGTIVRLNLEFANLYWYEGYIAIKADYR